jgi:hypothetical protein
MFGKPRKHISYSPERKFKIMMQSSVLFFDNSKLSDVPVETNPNSLLHFSSDHNRSQFIDFPVPEKVEIAQSGFFVGKNKATITL